jgi:flagellar hook-associated protein 2
MASITSAGIGSGLDVSGLVSQLVASERAATDTRLQAAQTKAQSQISALGTFRSVLADFQTAAQALRDGGATTLAATSSNTDLLTATASKTASAGSYNVQVVQLAQASKLASAAYASSSTALGTGTLHISVGSNSFDVAIGDSANTLAGIRDAINNASDNKGVQASLLNTSDGVRLTLTSTATGAANALGVSVTDSSGAAISPAGSGLDALAYTSGNQQLSQVTAAQDAQIKIDGYNFSSGTNIFSDAIAGVSFTATKADPNTTFAVNVGLDQNAVQTAAQTFVTKFNILNATIATYTRYDPTTKTAAALLGDPVALSLSQQMRSALTSAVGTGNVQTLSQLGITTGTDGSLSLDSTKFLAAVQSDPSTVANVLGKDGFGGKISNLADSYLDASDGRITAETDGANAQLKDISKQQDDLNTRMAAVQARYLAQFTALDTLVAQMKNTGTYLTQQLANLPGSSSSKSA